MPDLSNYKKILSAQKLNVKGWDTYKMIFHEEEGKVFEVGLVPGLKTADNKEDYVPEPGDLVEIKKSANNTWYIGKGKAYKPHEVEEMEKRKSSPRAMIHNSDTYWKDKTFYDQEIRDPKIERQHYNGLTEKVYTKMIEKSEDGIPTKEQMDAADRLILRAVRMGMKAYLLGLETEKEMKEGAHTEGEAQSNDEPTEDTGNGYHKVKVRGTESKKEAKPVEAVQTEELEEDEVPF